MLALENDKFLRGNLSWNVPEKVKIFMAMIFPFEFSSFSIMTSFIDLAKQCEFIYVFESAV